MIDKIHLSSIIEHLVLKNIEAIEDSEGLGFKIVDTLHTEKYIN